MFGYAGPACTDPNALTLEFRAYARTVTIEEAIPGPGGCVVSADDAVDFRGVTFRGAPVTRLTEVEVAGRHLAEGRGTRGRFGPGSLPRRS